MKKNTPISPALYQIVYLIRKAKNDELSDAEEQVLQRWVEYDPKNRVFYEKLLNEDFSAQTKDMLSRDISAWYRKTTKSYLRRRSHRWLGYGAAVAVAAMALYFVFAPRAIIMSDEVEQQVIGERLHAVTLSRGDVHEDLVVHHDSVYAITSLLETVAIDGVGAEIPHESIAVRTPIGQTITLRMKDGSTVYLNSNSELAFQANFDTQSERRVRLNGEAFFDVAHDVERPFIVANNSAEVKVLGTSFNVNAFDNRSKMKIALATGKVELSIRDIGVSQTLTPGIEVTYDKAKRDIAQHRTAIGRIGLWRTGVYAFDEISILEFAQDMEQLYPIQFVFEGKVPQYLFSGEISRNDSWEVALNKLELTNRVKFTINGNKITVRRGEAK